MKKIHQIQARALSDGYEQIVKQASITPCQKTNVIAYFFTQYVTALLCPGMLYRIAWPMAKVHRWRTGSVHRSGLKTAVAPGGVSITNEPVAQPITALCKGRGFNSAGRIVRATSQADQTRARPIQGQTNFSCVASFHSLV